MKIPDPEIYVGKILRVYSPDGIITEGPFAGYDYDFDDDGNEFLEFDVDDASTGIGYSFTEDEIERIEVIGTTKYK